MNALGDLLDCLVYKIPEVILPMIIDLVFDKLLKKKNDGTYEPTIANKNRKKLWLTLLEKALT
jgi:hypothetical protein